MNKRDPTLCTVPSCQRKRAMNSDLTCPAHWSQVPRKLKKALWKAQHLKSLKQNEWETIVAATNIVDYLDQRKVVLPPDVTIAKPESELETPTSNEPRIIRP